MLATLPFPTTITPQHPRFARKIIKLCTGIFYDKHGQPHVCIDEYMKRHLEIKLISSIVTKAETV